MPVYSISIVPLQLLLHVLAVVAIVVVAAVVASIILSNIVADDVLRRRKIQSRTSFGISLKLWNPRRVLDSRVSFGNLAEFWIPPQFVKLEGVLDSWVV